MKYEAIYDCPKELTPYALFLKYSYKYTVDKSSDKKVEELAEEDFLNTFPFVKTSHISHKEMPKKVKFQEFPLAFFKKEKNGFWYCSNDACSAQKSSGIFKNQSALQDYIKSLIPGSFGLQYRFILQAPYFSRDMEDFYIIDNPILKEKIWKVPMVRGAGWKGMLLKTASKKLAELMDKNQEVEAIRYFQSILRIFGTGSEEFRKIEKAIDDYEKNEKNSKNKIETSAYEIDLTSKVVKYALEELGINLIFSKEGKSIKEQIWQYFEDNIETIKTKKGRGVFYPTYFNRLDLEVINPHNRNTKAGTFPIYFEVVPQGTEGIFQFIYIPYDAVMLPFKELKDQVNNDYEIIKTLIQYSFEEEGIGAKSKYGWGKACIVEKDTICYLNM